MSTFYPTQGLNGTASGADSNQHQELDDGFTLVTRGPRPAYAKSVRHKNENQCLFRATDELSSDSDEDELGAPYTGSVPVMLVSPDELNDALSEASHWTCSTCGFCLPAEERDAEVSSHWDCYSAELDANFPDNYSYPDFDDVWTCSDCSSHSDSDARPLPLTDDQAYEALGQLLANSYEEIATPHVRTFVRSGRLSRRRLSQRDPDTDFTDFYQPVSRTGDAAWTDPLDYKVRYKFLPAEVVAIMRLFCDAHSEHTLLIQSVSTIAMTVVLYRDTTTFRGKCMVVWNFLDRLLFHFERDFFLTLLQNILQCDPDVQERAEWRREHPWTPGQPDTYTPISKEVPTLDAFLKVIDGIGDAVDNTANSPVMHAIGKIVACAAAHELLGGTIPAKLIWAGIISSKDVFTWSERTDVPQMISELLRSVSVVIRSLLRKRTGNCLLTINNEFEWIECVRWLKMNEFVRVSPSISEVPDGHVSDSIWRENLFLADRKSLTYLRTADPSLRSTMGKLSSELTEMLLKAKSADYASRPLPFNIAMVSPPGTGKSTYIAHSIYQSAFAGLGVAEGLTLDEVADRTCTVNFSDKYMSTYQSNRHIGVTFDEMGAANPVTNPNCEIMGNMTSFLGEGDFFPTRAAVDEKGKELFRPYVNICISNSEDFGISDYVVHKDAFYRRISVGVRVRIKPSFRRRYETTAQDGVDASKLAGLDRTSAVEFQILKDSSSGMVQIDPSEEGGWIDFYAMNDYITAAARQHARKTSSLKETRTFVDEKSLTRCEHGFYSCAICTPDLASENSTLFKKAGFTHSLPCNYVAVSRTMVAVPAIAAVGFASFFFSSASFRKLCVRGPKYLLKSVVASVIEDYKPDLMRELAELQALRKDMRWVTDRAMGYAALADAAVDRYYAARNNLLALRTKGMFKFFLIAIAGGAAVVAYRKWTAETHEPASFSELQGVPLPPSTIAGSSWNRNDDGFIQMGPASGSPIDVINNRVRRNMIQVEFVRDGRTDRTHLFGIKGQYAVGVWHTLKQFTSKDCTLHVLRCYSNPSTTRVTRLHAMKGSPNHVHRISDDLAVIYLSDVSAFKDISKLIAVKAQYTGSAGKMKATNSYYDPEPPFAIKTQDVSVEFTKQVNYTHQEMKHNPPALAALDAIVFAGLCGSPLVSMVGSQQVINGIVCAAGFDRGTLVSHCFDIAMFNEGISVLAPRQSVYTAISAVGFEDSIHGSFFEGAVEPAARYNHSFWLSPQEMGSINFRGSFSKAFTRKGKSSVVDFPLRDALFSAFPSEYHHNLVAPEFNHIIVDGVYLSPERQALGDMCTQVTGIDPDHLRQAVADYSAKLSSADDFKMDQILSTYEAVNGSTISPLATSIPKSTSAGFPYIGKKYEHLISAPCETAPHGHALSPLLEHSLSVMIARGAAGQRSGVVFKTAVKDEPRDAEKVALRKVRIFTLGPVDFLIYCKKFYGAFMTIYNRNFLTSETVGGINPFSPDWGRVYQRLSQFPNVINGDFSKFDKKSSVSLIMAAATVVVKVKEASLASRGLSMSEEYRNTLLSIASDIANPLLLLDKDMLELPGSLSSGVLMTFLFNDIINSLYIRMAYYHIYSEKFPERTDHVQSFSDNVCFFSLGDDNTYSVSNEAIVYFNFSAIQRYFTGIGIKYTNADKTDTDYGCLPIHAATIGKRKWSYDTEFQMWMCPIEKASILKMMSIGVKSKAVSLDVQQLQSIESAVPELAQYGREEYNTRVADLQQLAPDYVFPSYDSVLIRQRDTGITPWIPEQPEMISLYFEL
ncbi:polyprotein [Mizyes virus 1]|uniref:polyprotein n=1 Tax=Mizyes virus 1 TaxID=2480179 RepID=UPI000F0BDFAF|nr:polyprotein [Mizyes virus 1]AYN75556.1 polyprotein [Mizyes virus 1]